MWFQNPRVLCGRRRPGGSLLAAVPSPAARRAPAKGRRPHKLKMFKSVREKFYHFILRISVPKTSLLPIEEMVHHCPSSRDGTQCPGTAKFLITWSISELDTQVNPTTDLCDTDCRIQQVTAPTLLVTCWIQQHTCILHSSWTGGVFKKMVKCM